MKVKVFRGIFLDIWGLVAKGLIPRGGRGCDSQVGRGRVKGCGIEGFTKEKGELMIWVGGELDRSQSVIYFVPQENMNLTVKQARLR